MSYFTTYDSFGKYVNDSKSFYLVVHQKDKSETMVSTEIPISELDNVMIEVDAVADLGAGISIWNHQLHSIAVLPPGTVSKIEVKFVI